MLVGMIALNERDRGALVFFDNARSDFNPAIMCNCCRRKDQTTDQRKNNFDFIAIRHSSPINAVFVKLSLEGPARTLNAYLAFPAMANMKSPSVTCVSLESAFQ